MFLWLSGGRWRGRGAAGDGNRDGIAQEAAVLWLLGQAVTGAPCCLLVGYDDRQVVKDQLLGERGREPGVQPCSVSRTRGVSPVSASSAEPESVKLPAGSNRPGGRRGDGDRAAARGCWWEPETPSYSLHTREPLGRRTQRLRSIRQRESSRAAPLSSPP